MGCDYLYSFGSTVYGELALGGIEDEFITAPRLVKQVNECLRKHNFRFDVKQFTAGNNHCLLLLSSNSDMTAEKSFILSCGCNEKEQLGRTGACKKFETIDYLTQFSIIQIDCGFNHNIALSEAGQVFVWGCNRFGQLGINRPSEESVSRPALVKRLGHEFIIQVTAGGNHCLALSKTGTLYAWGSNTYGQTGVGNKEIILFSPEIVTPLRCVPIAFITSGGYHSIALSVTGVVYVWGRNDYGQLGLGDIRNRHSPSPIHMLKHQNIKYICCGSNHTAAITENGGLFTWGSGMYGQLGHGSTNNEIVPRQVFELMGVTVTQVSCGRCHTLAVVSPSNRLYTFGLNGCGQLGINSRINQLIPTAVKEIWKETCVIDNYSQTNLELVEMNPLTVTRIFEAVASKGDQSFILVTCEHKNICVKDFRETLNKVQKILFLDNSLLETIRNVPVDAQIPVHLVEYIENVFSSICCWNASYLSRNIDTLYIDWDAASCGFHCLENTQNTRIMEIITSILTKKVIKDLPLITQDSDIEVFRIYLLLPLLHLFRMEANDKNVLQKLICGHATAFLKVISTSHVSDLFCSSLSVAINHRLVDQLLITYKRVIITLLLEQEQKPKFVFVSGTEVRDTLSEEYIHMETNDSLHSSHLWKVSEIDCNIREYLRVGLEMLSFVHKVNKKCGKFKNKHFYIPQVTNVINLKYDYLCWLRAKQSNLDHQSLYFFNYPFVFDAKAKAFILEIDSKLQQKNAIQNTLERTLIVCGSYAIFESPHLILSVERHKLVADTINALIHNSNKLNFKKPLEVRFEGEDAVDAGSGMKKEFFLLLMKEVLDAKYGMFVEYKESNTIWFNPGETEDLLIYQLIGIVCGLAIYNQVLIYLPFPQILYKKLLNENLVINDLSFLDPILCKSLKAILSEDYTKEEFNSIYGDMNFTATMSCYGSPIEYVLLEDGRNKYLNFENRQLYVDLYWDFVVNKSVELQFEAFKSGFTKVVDKGIVSLFHSKELQQLIIGQETYDWRVLQKGTQYKPPFNAEHPTIIKFWSVFYSLSHEQKRKFLLFLTGSDRTPVAGLNSLKIKIQCMKVSEEHLPVAHVCFNLLDLPEVYSNEAKLKDKLLMAIENFQGFALV